MRLSRWELWQCPVANQLKQISKVPQIDWQRLLDISIANSYVYIYTHTYAYIDIHTVYWYILRYVYLNIHLLDMFMLTRAWWTNPSYIPNAFFYIQPFHEHISLDVEQARCDGMVQWFQSWGTCLISSSNTWYVRKYDMDLTQTGTHPGN